MDCSGSLRLGIVLLFFAVSSAHACQCPQSKLDIAETGRYEIIFRGTVEAVKPCGSAFGEAVFAVDELFKGNATDRFTVLFECDDCATGFRPGEEWIIYSRYKQINNAKMDWCSRSRKFFIHDKEDFFKVNSGVDYFEELNFLRKHLGLHRTLAEKENQSGNRNILPDQRQFVIVLLVSMAGIVAFYLFFRKLFK